MGARRSASWSDLADEPGNWVALVHPGQRSKPGSRDGFERNGHVVEAEVVSQHFHGRRSCGCGRRMVRPSAMRSMRSDTCRLPPYVKRDDTAADRERYQTVYARVEGSIAAPTAGLHFTPALFDALTARGIERATVTLHVGYGTFQPVRAEQVDEHQMEAERFDIPPATAALLTRALRERRRSWPSGPRPRARSSRWCGPRTARSRRSPAKPRCSSGRATSSRSCPGW